jgi:hypothetical protein
MSRTFITSADLNRQLQATNSKAAREASNNAELFAFLLEALNSTASMHTGKGSDVAFGLAEKTLSTSRFARNATNSKNLTAASTGIQAVIATASFVSLASKTSPTAVLPVVGPPSRRRRPSPSASPVTTTSRPRGDGPAGSSISAGC